MVVKVCVIGAGVVGLASAIHIQESLDEKSDIIIVADKFSPDTTTDGSGGFWKPHMLGDTPIEDIRRWSKLTWTHLLGIVKSPEAARTGSALLSGYFISSQPQYQRDWWSDLVFGYRNITPEELSMFPDSKSGVFFTSIKVQSASYMSYLMDRFVGNGGHVIKKTVSNISELATDYDIVVNCCGLSSLKLVNDTELVPVRGHVSRYLAAPSKDGASSHGKMASPWITHFVLKFDQPGQEAFVLPGLTSCTLGGVDAVGSWDTDIRQNDVEETWRRACKLFPSVKEGKVHSHWVGLQPSRSRVRLEKEILHIRGKNLPVIHNYGHGGSGVTLHWGCGRDVADLVKAEVTTSSMLTSKL